MNSLPLKTRKETNVHLCRCLWSETCSSLHLPSCVQWTVNQLPLIKVSETFTFQCSYTNFFVSHGHMTVVTRIGNKMLNQLNAATMSKKLHLETKKFHISLLKKSHKKRFNKFRHWVYKSEQNIRPEWTFNSDWRRNAWEWNRMWCVPHHLEARTRQGKARRG